MSCSSAARRTTGRPAGAASTARSVWSHRSSPGILFCGMPALGRELRRDHGEQPGVHGEPEAGGRDRRRQQLRRARRPTRSPLRWATSEALAAIAVERPRLDLEPERRREPNRPDHPERVLAEPGRRVADGPQAPSRQVVEPGERVGQAMSRRPASSPTAGPPQAIALTVKSRRARSASRSAPKATRCGRRKSAYSCSVRNGVISNTSCPRRTATVPNRFSYTDPWNSGEDLVRQRVRGEVPVRRPPVEERVAQRAADDVGRVPARAELVDERDHPGRQRGGEPAGRGLEVRGAHAGLSRGRQEQVGPARARCEGR